MSKPSLYLAAPLFNERERNYNEAIDARLGKFVDVFLPQRDGSLLVEMIKAGVALPVAERRVFEQDRKALRCADFLVAVLDGAHVDEGVAFELGFASALGCRCIGLQTDARRALPTGNNPMISGGLETVFADLDSLTAWLAAQILVSDGNVMSVPLRA